MAKHEEARVPAYVVVAPAGVRLGTGFHGVGEKVYDTWLEGQGPNLVAMGLLVAASDVPESEIPKIDLAAVDHTGWNSAASRLGLFGDPAPLEEDRNNPGPPTDPIERFKTANVNEVVTFATDNPQWAQALLIQESVNRNRKGVLEALVKVIAETPSNQPEEDRNEGAPGGEVHLADGSEVGTLDAGGPGALRQPEEDRTEGAPGGEVHLADGTDTQPVDGRSAAGTLDLEDLVDARVVEVVAFLNDHPELAEAVADQETRNKGRTTIIDHAAEVAKTRGAS